MLVMCDSRMAGHHPLYLRNPVYLDSLRFSTNERGRAKAAHISRRTRGRVMDTSIYPLAERTSFQLCSIPLRFRSVCFSTSSISVLCLPCLVVICFGSCHSMSIVVPWVVPGVEGIDFYLELVGEDEVVFLAVWVWGWRCRLAQAFGSWVRGWTSKGRGSTGAWLR